MYYFGSGNHREPDIPLVREKISIWQTVYRANSPTCRSTNLFLCPWQNLPYQQLQLLIIICPSSEHLPALKCCQTVLGRHIAVLVQIANCCQSKWRTVSSLCRLRLFTNPRQRTYCAPIKMELRAIQKSLTPK